MPEIEIKVCEKTTDIKETYKEKIVPSFARVEVSPPFNEKYVR